MAGRELIPLWKDLERRPVGERDPNDLSEDLQTAMVSIGATPAGRYLAQWLEEVTGNWQDPSGQVRQFAVVDNAQQAEIDETFDGAAIIDIVNMLKPRGDAFAEDALKMIGRNSPLAVACAIELVHRSVSEGNRLTDSIRISSQFPNLVVRMFKIGEESGNLSEALDNINYFYKRDVNDSVDSMVSLIQPILTVVMGSMIFWVIAAVFGPLYSSFSEMDF